MLVRVGNARSGGVRDHPFSVRRPEGRKSRLDHRIAFHGVVVGGHKHGLGHLVAEHLLNDGGGLGDRRAVGSVPYHQHVGGQGVGQDHGALGPGEGVGIPDVLQIPVQTHAHGLIDVGPGIACVHGGVFLTQGADQHGHGVLLGDAAAGIEGLLRRAPDIAGRVGPGDRSVIIGLVQVFKAGGVFPPGVVPAQHQAEQKGRHLLPAHQLVRGELSLRRSLDDADIGQHGNLRGSPASRRRRFSRRSKRRNPRSSGPPAPR